MANEVGYVRQQAKISAAPKDRGLEMNIKVVAYDNGIVMVNDNPIGEGGPNPSLSAGRFILQMLEQLELQSRKRRDEQQPDHLQTKQAE